MFCTALVYPVVGVPLVIMPLAKGHGISDVNDLPTPRHVPFGDVFSFNNKQTGRGHMKKIFILSSLIAVTLATTSFAEPTELDKKTVASKAYVDTKQDIIETGNVTFDEYEDIYVPGLVAYDSQTNALSGNKVGILDWDAYQESSVGASFDELGLQDLFDDAAFDAGYLDNYIPTVRFVVNAFKNITWDPQDIKAIRIYNTNFASTANSASLNWLGNGNSLISGLFLANSLAEKQNKIAKSGYYYPNTTSAAPVAYGQNSSPNGWLYSSVKGTGLVTKTASNGVVGERKIFEATDVANYHATGLTQIQQDIQDISIPTVGAVMNIVSTNAPTGTANTLANYDANGALGTGIATANAPTHNATTGVLENGTNIATIAAVDTRQKKKECGGYEPAAAGQPAHDGTHPGDEDYCWLWIFPED
jgi:hypothetical protein